MAAEDKGLIAFDIEKSGGKTVIRIADNAGGISQDIIGYSTSTSPQGSKAKVLT